MQDRRSGVGVRKGPRLRMCGQVLLPEGGAEIDAANIKSGVFKGVGAEAGGLADTVRRAEQSGDDKRTFGRQFQIALRQGWFCAKTAPDGVGYADLERVNEGQGLTAVTAS